MSVDKSQPRLAATLAVVRDAPGGLEVLLLQRADKGDHNSLAWVFPGGLVDPGDRVAHAHSEGLDDAAANGRLGLAEGGLDLYLAAIREAFEEAGLLFAEGTASADARALGASRSALREGQLDLAGFCQRFGLRLRADRLHHIAHWLTPRGRPKRFDTRFFVAVLPEGQASLPDNLETVQQVWLRPAQALAPENTRRLMTPTRAVLEQLGAFADTRTLLAWAGTPRRVERVLPRLARGATGPEPVLPDHPSWDEIGWLDSEGRGTVAAQLQPGVPVALVTGVWRLSAAGPLTNSYLVDCSADGWAVIDPGPDDDAHLDALIGAAPGPIRWVGVTDGDVEQRQAAARLSARTGAQPLGALNSGALRALPGSNPHATLYVLADASLLFSGVQSADVEPFRTSGAAWAAPRHGFVRAVAAQTKAAS